MVNILSNCMFSLILDGSLLSYFFEIWKFLMFEKEEEYIFVKNWIE